MTEEQAAELRYEAGMYQSLYETAAARIEALEAALREIIAETTYKDHPIKTPQSTEEIWMIARAALDKDAP